MHKKATILVIMAVLIIAAVLVCMIPRFTHVENTALQATKLTNRGEILGTYEIVLRGSRQDYLFGDPVLELSVAPFDILRDFVMETEIRTATAGEICYVLYSATNTATDDANVIRIYFSPDMDRWLFLNDTDLTCYVASVSGAYSAQNLMDYFGSVIPDNG